MIFKMCPRCGSRKVKWIIPQNWSTWQCFDCDYTGPIIEGDEVLSAEIHEAYVNGDYEEIPEEEDFEDDDDLDELD